ncbi:MAG TPA: metalloregulator ArsR/SmtB family transcription factor [Blastocatellia bacterium]|nr:metalloregulator ArsR/SmtB family transcription factor [Blastocatellia bacterium]
MKRAETGFDPEKFFLALSDKTRLRLLNLMGDDEVCVCFFVKILQENQPKISQHLAYLRKAGVVATRREGKWMHYRIITPTNPYAAQILRNVRNWLEENPEMRLERERLIAVCCSPELSEALQDAPRPAGIGKLKYPCGINGNDHYQEHS